MSSSTIVPLRDDISFIAGAAISCGTGTAWGALERLDLKANQTIAIFGMGPVGLSAVMLAHSMGAKIIALDTNKQRLNTSIEFGIGPNVETPDFCDDDSACANGTVCHLSDGSKDGVCIGSPKP